MNINGYYYYIIMLSIICVYNVPTMLLGTLHMHSYNYL